MTDTLSPTDATDYERRLADLSTVPFWRLGELDEPVVPERAHVWHWDEVVPELFRSRELDDRDVGALQRHALLLRNPGLGANSLGATHTMVAAYQMLFPGESAPMHAHSFSALRFGASGSDARMVVDGVQVPLGPGDLLLTPAWCWHGHAHPGGDEPAVWFDGLDVPFVTGLRAGFYRPASPALDRLPLRTSPGTEPVGLAITPVDHRRGAHSPVRRYPWDVAHEALQRALASTDEAHGATVEYRNPVTGGPALATIACSLQGVPAGGTSSATRETASAVCFVVSGTGDVVVDGVRHRFGPKDVVAVPAWTWHQVIAGEDVVLFRISDRPILDALSLYRVEHRD